MPWGKHPGCLRTRKGWWWGNRVSWSSETCMAQGRGVSGLAQKGLITAVRKRWTGRQKNPELLKEKCAEKASGSRSKAAWTRWQKQTQVVGPSGEAETPPSAFSRKHMRGWEQKLHSYCLGKKSPQFREPVGAARSPVRTRHSKFYSQPMEEKINYWMFFSFF